AASCTTEDRREMQLMWGNVWSAQFTGRRIAIAQAVFKDLFANVPDAVGLFGAVKGDEVNSNEFKAHCIRVVNGLDSSIGLLSDPATLNEQLSHLATQHKARSGVTKGGFSAIAQSFLRVMPQVASCFNPDAWSRCFNRITTGMTEPLPA
uniref:hemoglobin B2 chain n=1 Tax=Riftia pachyptila TaxID=6426 RepID=UPI00004C9D0E|nr:Chain D, hemoglobin B2 chain [Riftia pachyptila]1YHU_H Chain H, hemoglobin B2 chain [Riftia pachyptila]1YHU_L Chain L, hemoglobin B2 chain [Riftia pachyptila]1YHU_P Chain P, hemoglobin B2 chain [Riftia pachyptila]1YHU_T Chain T, hemoglobin B2 chain [Riftia pachyptila]1YHU_X Chain X, hemoglobin B2 chain [Riftia pachyptila]